MHSGPGVFPTTQWGLFADIRHGSPAAHRDSLDILIRRYWKPVFLGDIFSRRIINPILNGRLEPLVTERTDE